ncbi:MAG: HDOD domain-containing protein [Spirochaetales bacterium]
MAKEVEADKVVQAARSSIPLTVRSYTLPHETEVYLEEILGLFLKELGQERLKDPLAYCLRELAVNAKKANTKRVYFKERGLDLLNKQDYDEGMRGFKQETLDNIQHFLELQKQNGLYVKIIFHTKAGRLNLYVCNNTEILRHEQIRVYDRIARSRAFDSLEEAMTTVLDDSEGAGLGIVILVLMLKKIGLDEDAFDIDVKNGETVARIVIPMAQVKAGNLDMISEKLVQEIDRLPGFPENIVNLQRKIDEPEVELSEVARLVSTDPALTADLLKVVNSAAFMLPKRVDNIVEAVKLVGLRALKNLLFQYGAQKVLGSGTPETKQLWHHSYRTAYYAYNLARSITKKKEILDDVYAGGILHDMGKIIFSSSDPEMIDRIERFCVDKGIPTELFEDLSSGLNHAEIGGRIAQKWNFPEALVSAIEYHHHPAETPPEHKDVVYTVYMANVLSDPKHKDFDFDQFDRDVMTEFNVKGKEQLETLRARLENMFEREQLNGRSAVR